MEKKANRWDFPGWGTAERIDDLGGVSALEHHTDPRRLHRLGQWKATAICGNDITSSCLYVVALCTIYAGPYAPLALGAVALVLYLFRSIYAEVGSALPLNGGAYNVLLNTTTKAKASVAACLTLLSYIATAVISGYEAMHYAHNLYSTLNIFWAAIVLLGLFAVLNIVGISESAVVALALFIFHMATLTLLVAAAGWKLLGNTEMLLANWAAPVPQGAGSAIFFGFSAAMLGISGFESSANFIEEQRDGVFPKTLRNMWIAVTVFNPTIALLALGILPLGQIASHREDLLAEMGLLAGGPWLRTLVSIDAVLVLSGAVLTAYVGVTGLVRRMSLDRCLPQVLLRENSWRNTNHWIILLFFALCCSILAMSKGRVETLAGVYTISFLGVMALFAFGNMLLKVQRARLPRAVRASWGAVLLGLAAVGVALTGNLLLNPEDVKIFLIYFAVALAVVAVMFLRVQILRSVLAVSKSIVERIQRWNRLVNLRLIRHINRINRFQVVYFSRGDNLAALNRAASYVLDNELTTRLRVVHCFERETDIAADLAQHLSTIDRIYPKMRIDLLLVKGKFGPELIDALSRRLGVPKNYMFIGTPGDTFPHNIAELGGVRLIM